jgi:hypothetical protein
MQELVIATYFAARTLAPKPSLSWSNQTKVNDCIRPFLIPEAQPELILYLHKVEYALVKFR